MNKNQEIRDNRLDHLPRIQDYVIHRLLPRLGYKGSVVIKPAEAGIRSLVYFVEGPKLEPIILRAEGIKRRFKRRVKGHQLLLQLGFKVPRIVFQDLNRTVRQRYGFHFLVETRLPGVHFGTGQDTVSECFQLGKTLARMHDVTSWGHGWPGELRWPGNLGAALQLRRQTREVLKAYRAHQGSSPKRIETWLSRQSWRSWSSMPRLTTAGLKSSNLLVCGDRIAIIDLARVRFTRAARDLAQVSLSLTQNNDKSRESFFEAYQRYASQKLWSEVKTTLALHEVLYLLRRASGLKMGGKVDKDSQRKLLKYCK
jgi:hypothetical protein